MNPAINPRMNPTNDKDSGERTGPAAPVAPDERGDRGARSVSPRAPQARVLRLTPAGHADESTNSIASDAAPISCACGCATRSAGPPVRSVTMENMMASRCDLGASDLKQRD
jgi:hypothetical protein